MCFFFLFFFFVCFFLSNRLIYGIVHCKLCVGHFSGNTEGPRKCLTQRNATPFQNGRVLYMCVYICVYIL